MLKFLSICSGIEAASVAFAPLGWQALAFAEIEPFPCAVLAHHYGASRPWHMPQPMPHLQRLAIVEANTPWASWAIMDKLRKDNLPREAAIRAVADLPDPGQSHTPNLGDLTRWRTWPASLLVQVQLLCGGTPCQAFSVAGLRKSLSDDRGNLTLIFCELYAHINTLRRAAGLPPALLLWENVPGVLNTPDNAFGCFLAGIAGESDALQPPGGRWENAGYVSGPEAAAAYRTLDAQYFGLAQRRRRVFVVASPDPAFDPAAVLFEFTGLRRDTPPSRRTRQDTAPTLSARTKGGGGLGTDADADCDGAAIAERVAASSLSKEEKTPQSEGQSHRLPQSPCCAGTLRSTDGGSDVDHALGNHIIAAAETGAGFWTDDGLARLRCSTAPTQPQNIVADLAGTLSANGKAAGSAIVPIGPHAEAYRTSGNCGAWPTGDKIDALTTGTDPTSHIITQEPFAFDLRGRDGGAMPEGPHATAAIRASSGGSSRSYVAAPLPFDTTQITSAANRSQPQSGDPCHPLASGAHPPAVAIGFEPRFYLRDNKTGGSPSDIAVLKADACKAGDGSPHVAYDAQSFNAYQRTVGDVASPIMAGDSKKVEIGVLLPPETTPSSAWRVRRLTPEECELLQGFPIGYTLIPGHSPKKRKGQDLTETIAYLISLGIPAPDATLLAHSPDGPRYKALGNSWAVRVARWIAHRIQSHLSKETLRAGSADSQSAPVPL